MQMQSHANGGNANGGNQMSPSQFHNTNQSHSMGAHNRNSQGVFNPNKPSAIQTGSGIGMSQTKPNSPVNPNIGGVLLGHRPASSSNSRQPQTAGGNSMGGQQQQYQQNGIYLSNMNGQKRLPTASKNHLGSPMMTNVNSPNGGQPLVVGRNKLLSSTQPIITLKSMKRGGEPVNQMRTGGDGKVNYAYFYQQQMQQQQYAQGSPYGQNGGGAAGLITQVQRGGNQVPLLTDLPPEVKQALLAGVNMSVHQKFGKEPLPPPHCELPPQKAHSKGKKTLALDLDETLVHSSFKPPPLPMKPDIILPVEIEGQVCKVFVLVRPGTEFFLQRLSKVYELVIYTASLSKYADPLVDILDARGLIDSRLFREHCTSIQGVYVKDMSLLGRPMQDSIIIDNSPTSYTFHPENAIPILSWYDDPKDRCLFELIPLLESLAEVDDVRKYLPQFITHDHRVDFQRASHVLANAITNPSLNNDKKQRIMSMHRVSEHREEDEIDPDDNLAQRNKKKVSGGLNMAAADAAQDHSSRESPSLNKSSKLSQKKKSHLVFNNQWTLDEEDRNKAAAAASQQEEGQGEPNSDEIGPLPSTESPSKKKSRYQSTKPPMYNYAANQQESTTQVDEDKQPGSNIMNKRPSTRDRVANAVGSQSANNTNQYFSRTQNQQQIDGSPGGGSSNQLPPKKALTNQRLPNPATNQNLDNLALEMAQQAYGTNGQSAKTPNERKRREGSQSWQRPPQGPSQQQLMMQTQPIGQTGGIPNATPKQLQNTFLQRFFPVQNNGGSSQQQPPLVPNSPENPSYRQSSQSNNRDLSMKSLRSNAAAAAEINRQSFLFNNKHRKVKKTSTNRGLLDGAQNPMNNTQPMSIVSQGFGNQTQQQLDNTPLMQQNKKRRDASSSKSKLNPQGNNISYQKLNHMNASDFPLTSVGLQGGSPPSGTQNTMMITSTNFNSSQPRPTTHRNNSFIKSQGLTGTQITPQMNQEQAQSANLINKRRQGGGTNNFPISPLMSSTQPLNFSATTYNSPSNVNSNLNQQIQLSIQTSQNAGQNSVTASNINSGKFGSGGDSAKEQRRLIMRGGVKQARKQID